MSAKGAKNLAVDEVPVGDEEISIHQEAVPGPYLGGTRRVALRWMTGALERVTQQAPDEQPTKK